jgi:DNA-binding XRE family transcriptional regulator
VAETSRRRPVSFAELAGLLDRLEWLVSDARRARQLTLAEAGTEIGVNASTLMRVEHGGDCSLKNAVLIRTPGVVPHLPRCSPR